MSNWKASFNIFLFIRLALAVKKISSYFFDALKRLILTVKRLILTVKNIVEPFPSETNPPSERGGEKGGVFYGVEPWGSYHDPCRFTAEYYIKEWHRERGDKP